ncbi:major royal jelly protein 1-like [Phymastichus coffea]|uniref:major royal jelly protein 1-like n=1 Tax=Phymastichus coffea TaxID=108790 RepID=UPI00273C648A|nr:major royal jelly protein 1-like [Phymastichus coffea]
MQILSHTLVLFTSLMLVSAISMDTIYEWKYVDYVWGSEARRKQIINTGEYNASEVIPMDVNKASDGRVFISLLGTMGTPASLGIVTDQMGPSGPLIKPYPNWSYFERNNCDSIQNVYRIMIDECERLWVLDTGTKEEQSISCDPQLLAFDLRTDHLIQRIKIPTNIARGSNNDTLLAIPIVETRGPKCEDTTVFMMDPMGRGLVIWNNGRLSRLEHSLFGPSEDATNITSGNQTLRLAGGIVTGAISPSLFPGETRFLYFHSLASFDLYAASTETLKRSRDGLSLRFLGTKNILSSQALGVAFSAESTFFMGLTRESAIACWNRYMPLEPHNVKIVVQDNERLQYINGMKIIAVPYSKDEELWVLSNRFLAFQRGQLNFNDNNFRILKGSVKKLITNTVCELPRKTRQALEDINKYNDILIVHE